MSDTPNPDAGAPAKNKKLPLNLIILFVIIGCLCLYILFNMMRGFQMFNTYQPDTEHMTPASPGFP